MISTVLPYFYIAAAVFHAGFHQFFPHSIAAHAVAMTNHDPLYPQGVLRHGATPRRATRAQESGCCGHQPTLCSYVGGPTAIYGNDEAKTPNTAI